jgi:hypothetical protein
VGVWADRRVPRSICLARFRWLSWRTWSPVRGAELAYSPLKDRPTALPKSRGSCSNASKLEARHIRLITESMLYLCRVLRVERYPEKPEKISLALIFMNHLLSDGHHAGLIFATLKLLPNGSRDSRSCAYAATVNKLLAQSTSLDGAMSERPRDYRQVSLNHRPNRHRMRQLAGTITSYKRIADEL